METTFISIHDLSLDARLLYASNSIGDILGYHPAEVIGKSCWEYFHPEELPFARAIHGRGVQLDKAAVLNYCKIRDKNGWWVSCECVFTIVHDVLVASTSIYRRGSKSLKRAEEAPVIRQLFSSSPRDPRYHMLTYISAKFTQPTKMLVHEPRAALFLNRFTRTLTIMYATNGLADLLGISAEELNGKSFYYCIQENCLQEAVKCLESAKANDSIAYLRFWFRDPRDEVADQDETMSDTHSSDDDDGGVHLSSLMDTGTSDYHENSRRSLSKSSNSTNGGTRVSQKDVAPRPKIDSLQDKSRSSSGNSTDLGENGADFMFDRPRTPLSSSSEMSIANTGQSQNVPSQLETPQRRLIELEAVVSCTSDGLVVVLRAARPFLSYSMQPDPQTAAHTYTNGLFASPWATQPIMPEPAQHNGSQYQPYEQPSPDPATTVFAGPPVNNFMQSIREVAVFAWALTGINGSLEQYSRGTSSGESQPPTGLPIWDPHSTGDIDRGQRNMKGTSAHHIDRSNYRPYAGNGGIDAWDAQSRIRHWTGSQQNVLSVASNHHSPLQRTDDESTAPWKTW